MAATEMTLPHPFDRSGLASLSDLAAGPARELFKKLEAEHAAFLEKEKAFRSPQYKWPRDPLHTWSRCWEYPYVYYHLARWRSGLAPAGRPVVVDVGSGVTFFPFTVARLGCEVVCTDIDPVCESDYAAATRVIPMAPGNVSFRLSTEKQLPLQAGEAEAVYCVSVLEHIPDLAWAVEEMARITRPGGRLIVTFDVDMRGDTDIGVERYAQLKAGLRRHFDWLAEERTTHPADLLLSDRGPWPLPSVSGLRRLKFMAGQVRRRMTGQPRRYASPYFLAVEGLVLERRGAR